MYCRGAAADARPASALRRAATLDAGCSGRTTATGATATSDRAHPLRLQCAPPLSGWSKVARGRSWADPRANCQVTRYALTHSRRLPPAVSTGSSLRNRGIETETLLFAKNAHSDTVSDKLSRGLERSLRIARALEPGRGRAAADTAETSHHCFECKVVFRSRSTTP